MSGPLAVTLAGVELRTPILVASGTFGAGREGSSFVPLHKLGGIIVKSMTIVPWTGRPTPRMWETPSGMLNSIGIQNKGVDHFVAEDLPWLKERNATVFASIAGNTVDEFGAVAERLRPVSSDLAGVEVNISCPNLEDRNRMFAHSAPATTDVVGRVKRALTHVPIFPKLSPNVTSIVDIADAALQGGADGLALINTALGMAIDPVTRRPRLAGTMGGLSGPAIRPIAVRAVHEVHRAFPHVPLIGQGGVRTASDALEMILAGATAVAVGTANFVDPTASLRVTEGVAAFMKEQQISSIADLVGAVKIEE